MVLLFLFSTLMSLAWLIDICLFSHLYSSSESLNPSNNTSTMPSSELSYDAYRFRRLNDQEQMTTSTNPTSRLRNVAKVEPYSINPTMIRPLYQSSPSPSSSLPTTKIIPATIAATTVVPPSQARTVLNSMGNTPTHSSASSSAGSLNGMIRHPNVRHSDFLVPNPAYTAPAPVPSTPSVPPSASHRSQRLSNSSSYATPPPPSRLLSDSLSQRATVSNAPLYNGRSTTLATSINDPPQKHRGAPQEDFQSTKVIPLNCSGWLLRSICSSSNRIHHRSTVKARELCPVKTPINMKSLITTLHRLRITIAHETSQHQPPLWIRPSMLIETSLKDRRVRSLPIRTIINNSNRSNEQVVLRLNNSSSSRDLVVVFNDGNKWSVRKVLIFTKTRQLRTMMIILLHRQCRATRPNRIVNHDRSVGNTSQVAKVTAISLPRHRNLHRPRRILNGSIERL